MPSNLVEVPRVNEKYEIRSFQSGAYKENFMSLNLQKDLGDVNVRFYESNKSRDPLQQKDWFQEFE